MAIKDQYEKELRNGQVVVSVPAADDGKKKLAADVMREHGGHFINVLAGSRSRAIRADRR